MHPEDGRVVSNFIVQALRGEPLTIYGEGQQSRSFCFVDDLIEGFIRFMDLETPEGGGTQPGPINLGNPGEFTILELAQQVLELTGSGSRLNFHPLPSDDPTQRRPDIRKAQDLLSWEPRIPLSQGLAMTIDYFRKLMSETSAVSSTKDAAC